MRRKIRVWPWVLMFLVCSMGYVLGISRLAQGESEILKPRRPHAMMPREYLKYRVCDLGVGESAWLDPHFISVNRDRQIGIFYEAEVLTKEGGSARVKIVRLADGFQLDISRLAPGERTWGVRRLEFCERVVELVDK